MARKRESSTWFWAAMATLLAFAVIASAVGCASTQEQYHRLALFEKPKGQVATVILEKKTPVENGKDVPERATGLAAFFESMVAIPEGIGNLIGLGFITDTAQVISGDVSESYQSVETWRISVEAEEDVFDIDVTLTETETGINPTVHVQKVSDALNGGEAVPE